MQDTETVEVKKLIKTKLINDLLMQGNFHKTNEAFKQVCFLMNGKNTLKRKKWNYLGEDHPNKWKKGRSLLLQL